MVGRTDSLLMSSFKSHARLSSKRSHSDLSRSTTPIPSEADIEDLASSLPDFLKQTQDDRDRQASFETSLFAAPGEDDNSNGDSDHPWAIDSGDDVRSRNRYTDIKPWTKNRVKLKVKEGELDYINASPISLTRTDGTHALRYIATQGPKASSVNHFWQMVWHECGQTAVIVMLTQLAEGGREKCYPYYPSDPEINSSRPPLSRSSSRASRVSRADTATPPPNNNNNNANNTSLGPPKQSGMLSPVRASQSSRHSSADPSTATQPSLSITLTSDSGEPRPATLMLIDTSFDEVAHATVRKLSLTCENEARIVYHLLFSGWPDFGIPQGANRAAMLNLIRLSEEKNYCEESEPGPRIVHCSAGVGRTGTLISLEHLLAELDSGAWDDWSEDAQNRYTETHSYQGHDIDPDGLPGTWPDPIFDTVSRLREQRATMVQAIQQYLFIYEIMAEEWIKRRRRLLEEKKQLAGPSPKAIRLGEGLKKMLSFGKGRGKDKDTARAQQKVDNTSSTTDGESTGTAGEQRQA